ncbi:isoaspartyl peptidase/L-asparaginase family protein [Archangium violaceum]|uniref:isoaspartyl peptidase/L-asparaginase family protein n=1 Tax=Archangium violaceum TaxID=83451 RepID=UPI003D265163
MSSSDDVSRPAPRWGIVIHGGAGVIKRESLSPEREAAVRAVLNEALQAGHSVLAKGGSSLDAVTAAVRVMEDSPLFNAGKGAVFTHDGKNELDAAIMNGRTRAAGAVAGLHHVKNPITLARAVMEKSPHVMMIGAGAEEFAKQQGVELVPESYFHTEERWESLQRALEAEKKQQQAPAEQGQPQGPSAFWEHPAGREHKFGTVGAVALDQAGNLAAGTSTGGMTNKRFGRVGDVPVIGAGTYANERCAVSATGHGEYFIRYTVARDICSRMEYLELPLLEAANQVVLDVLVKAGGEGGVIAMDAQGNVAMPFNSAGMYRGYMGPDGVASVAIFKE